MESLVSPMAVLKWVLIAYVLFMGVRYLMVVRVYLMYAYRDGQVTPITRQQLDPGALELLTSLDDSLAAAGFRHLGFAQTTPILTHYDKPGPYSVFVNEAIPAYAIVRPPYLPDYTALANLQLQTTLESGIDVATFNMRVSKAFIPPDMRVGAVPGLSIATLVEVHQHRVAAAAVRDLPARHTGFEDVLERLQTSLQGLRAHCRERGWTIPTSDSAVDRFTLWGALCLARSSLRVIGARPKGAQTKMARPVPTEAERRLRVEADMLAVMAVAENPERVPGTPWPLIAVAIATALVSLVTMGWLWNFYVAAVVLAAVAFHEAGHAAAMRRFGYRDVHIFFVPLLGALTTGRPATASVRDRLVVLLAGPVPGLWLGLILAVLEKTYFPGLLLRVAAPVLLVLNGLNLLPFTPLDGGRAMEVLTRPESIWRVVIHVVSALALIALGIHFHDKLLAGIGGAWLSQIPRQWQAYQLRRAVAAAAPDKTDFRAVARLTLETITANPRYASWRAATRQATARAFGRSFADAPATSADRVWGAIAYASAWIPIGAWFLIRAS